jgi:hypothetical protein
MARQYFPLLNRSGPHSRGIHNIVEFHVSVKRGADAILTAENVIAKRNRIYAEQFGECQVKGGARNLAQNQEEV